MIVMFLFGAGKLPEIGGALGRGIKEFRDSVREVDTSSEAKGSQDKGSD